MSVFSRLFGWLADQSSLSAPSPAPIGTGQRRCSSPDRSRCNRQFYEERGWRTSGSELRGYYRTRLGAVQGRIERPFSTKPRFFVISPPSALLNGPHGLCFRARGKDEYWVHFAPEPRDVNTGIMRIEHCIEGSMR